MAPFSCNLLSSAVYCPIGLYLSADVKKTKPEISSNILFLYGIAESFPVSVPFLFFKYTENGIQMLYPSFIIALSLRVPQFSVISFFNSLPYLEYIFFWPSDSFGSAGANVLNAFIIFCSTEVFAATAGTPIIKIIQMQIPAAAVVWKCFLFPAVSFISSSSK